MTFEDRSNATVTDPLPSARVAGQIPIHRIVTGNVALCEALAFA